jgi:glucose/arabinose dehydrogenase
MNRVVAFALVVACGSDARAPERVALPARVPARAIEAPIPAPTPPPPPDASIAPPPGSDALVRVPADVARGITLRAVARDLERPVLLTFAPGDARRRLFVVEQRGAIRTIESGKVGKKPFFTIGGLSTGNEQGLLGLAFHPQFATNGRLYVYFTTKDKHCHVVEYKVDARDPDRVDPASARELADLEHPYSNHNGGNLVFGPDGKLYAGIGDGGAANDPHGNGQNPTSLLAKLLRFDVEAPSPRAEIVHVGLRNPWRFWFDAKTGDLYIGDVGQNLWEEVDVVPAGTRERVNFGWNVLEGTHCFDAATGRTKAECDRDGLAPPAVEYGHDQGCSITGGVTYRGKALPELDGRYFYADYCTGLLRSFAWTRGFVREHWDWKASIDREGVLQQVSSFGVDADGEVYIVELTGTIYELVRRS